MSTPKLYYKDTGARGKHTVIFLHAFPFNHTMWDEQANLIADKYRVVVYDHRGHGQSELGSDPYLFESFVDDLFGLMDTLHIVSASLVGLSMGGYVALRAIERQPERVRGLVLCDTRSEADGDAAKLKRSADLKLIQDEGLAVFAERFLKNALASESAKNKLVSGRAMRMIMGNSASGVQAALVALATRTDTTASLNRLSGSTLILVGAEDTITPPSAANSLHEHIPGSKIEVIPAAGHLSNLENPSVFNAHLMDYLTSIHS